MRLVLRNLHQGKQSVNTFMQGSCLAQEHRPHAISHREHGALRQCTWACMHISIHISAYIRSSCPDH